MSEILPTNVICPGQRQLLGEGHNYLRAMFMVYWVNSSPSAEPFFLHEHHFKLSFSGVAALEAEVLMVMEQHDDMPIRAVYLGYEGIAMTTNDISNIGWRLLGDHPSNGLI